MVKIEMQCPRCTGKGRRQEWTPDAGVCYRCQGKGTVVIDLGRYERALCHLRARYRALRIVVLTDPSEEIRDTAQVELERVTQDGIRLRTELDKAKKLV